MPKREKPDQAEPGVRVAGETELRHVRPGRHAWVRVEVEGRHHGVVRGWAGRLPVDLPDDVPVLVIDE